MRNRFVIIMNLLTRREEPQNEQDKKHETMNK